jgi:shikimate dehydrogenase
MTTETPLLKACVLGFPVSHSLSPKLHGAWLKQYNIHGSYTTMAVMPDNLKDALKVLVDRGFAGCNLTLPLKELAMPMMDSHDESCVMSGAVNTVVMNNGKMTGYNSDGFGFLENLTAQYPDWNGERVVVLGTGGAARGIIASLRGAGAEKFILVNRTRDKAEKVISAFKLNAESVEWELRHEALADATLVVNCTSLGMAEQPRLDLSLQALPTSALVCDIVYRPLQTNLLLQAQAQGNPVLGGLGMLLHQGRLGFQHWFGIDPAVTPELYQTMAEAAQ